ncbi:ANTAR domain-containing protein [Verminephrobacter eiseniae]|nr:ANTAR domain-containing protein [Verminephrobacter sp. Larva24]MCW5232734.1 ANTAR domain-containing protein [Verminephrobacter eiseniae]MCW5236734.1 ANTAR domain-containing protein [Verminephrobacter eiseniae]MCW5260840.1 ANTAR domain-containing protein [Verminephrobacter eiseniae]MCW5286062.1 ANTAR domain-containing protein [Verminephrobacter eiseniae]
MPWRGPAGGLSVADGAAPKRHTLRVTSPQLKELRLLKIAVLHPDDADGRQLTQQLQRIGCQVQVFWPPVQVLPEGIDVAFMAVQPDFINLRFEWAHSEDAPAIIAVVTYENPTIVEAVLEIGAKAVLPSPVRSFGLLSALVVAREAHKESRSLARRLRKVEAKLLGVRQLTEAKAVLMKTHNVSEGQAYDLIREQAMSKRTTMEEIAAAIVNASEILSLGVHKAGQG